MDRTGLDRDFGGESEEAAQRHRIALAQAKADRERRAQEARAQADAERVADAERAIEQRLRAAFVGTEAEWNAEKADLIRQERHRLTAERDAMARAALASRYQ